MRLVLVRSFCLSTLLLAGATHAGILRGTVHVPAPASEAGPVAGTYPGRASSLPNAQPTVRGLASDAVVYLERGPSAADSVIARWPRSIPRLAQKQQAFVPRVIAVAQGGRVDFPNLDPIYHNVFSLSPARRFDLGKYPRGNSRQVTFTKPGLVKVYCDIHSDMEAFVLVLQNPGFTRPDANGAFAFPELPAGKYRLRIWHPDHGEQTREVEVPAEGKAECDISY